MTEVAKVPAEQLFVKARDERVWDIKQAKRDEGMGRKARDYIRAACQEKVIASARLEDIATAIGGASETI